MQRLMLLAQGLNHRFPKGNQPFRITTRLAEECGEVASEVLHMEGGEMKRLKHGEPDPEKLAGEIKNVLSVAMQLALYYGVEEAVASSIEASIGRLTREGHLPPGAEAPAHEA